MKIMYPSSVLTGRKVDEHFQQESQGRFPLIYDASSATVKGTIEGYSVLYRGWILAKNEYDEMAQAVANAGGEILVPTQEYLSNQYVDNWYKFFQNFTPKTLLFDPETPMEEVVSQSASIGESFIVKDSSKSMKDYWEEACFAPNVEELPKIITRFRELADPSTGSLVVREFENFQKGECRVWWWNNVAIHCEPHAQTPNFTWDDSSLQDFLKTVRPAVDAFDSQFFTMDVSLNMDNEWRIVEIGDGQVCEASSLTAIHSILDRIDLAHNELHDR